MEEGSPSPESQWKFIVIAAVAIAVVIAGGAYFLLHTDFFAAHDPFTDSLAPAYLTQNNDGVAAWYDYEQGVLTQHLAPAPGIITALARQGNATYLILSSQTASSTTSSIYRFDSGAYTKLYTDTHLLWRLSVSANASLLAFAQITATTTNAVVIDVQRGHATLLASSEFAPQFLSAGGLAGVVYADGTNLKVRSYDKGSWQAPKIISSAFGASMSAFATDGGGQLAFIDPVKGTIHEWQVSSLAPFTATEKAVYPPYPGFALTYSKGKLFGYHYALKEDKGLYEHITAYDLASSTALYAAPASLGSHSSVFLLSPLSL